MLCSLFNFVLGLLGHLDVSAGHVDLGPPHHQALGRLVSYTQSHTQFIFTLYGPGLGLIRNGFTSILSIFYF